MMKLILGMIVASAVAVLLVARVSLGQARSPGDDYADGTAVSDAPYGREIAVYGSVETNNVLVFMDRTGARVRGTNMTELIVVASTNLQYAIDAEAVARAAGDDIAKTNHIAAIAAEALDRIAGDAANRADLAYYASTGGVTRIIGTNCWQTVEDGISYVYSVSTDTNRVYIVSASDDYNGPAVGTICTYDETSNDAKIWKTTVEVETFDIYLWVSYNYVGDNWLLDFSLDPSRNWISGYAPNLDLPIHLLTAPGAGVGTCVIDYVPITNSYPLASMPDIASHNTDGTAHADIRQAIDAIPLPPTNAIAGWLVWDSGSNVYWRVSATNLRFYVWGVSE